MDHKEAISTFAVERYTLGEMTLAERDAFEEHFFDCGECAMAVREAAAFADGAKSLSRRDRSFRPRKLMWLAPIAAALVIGVGIGRIGPKETFDYDHPMPTVSLRGDVRGETPLHTVGANRAALLEVEIPPAAGAAGYIVTLRGRDGRVLQQWQVTPEQAADTVSLPLRPLSQGGYAVVIESADNGGRRAEITRYSLDVGGSPR